MYAEMIWKTVGFLQYVGDFTGEINRQFLTAFLLESYLDNLKKTAKKIF